MNKYQLFLALSLTALVHSTSATSRPNVHQPKKLEEAVESKRLTLADISTFAWVRRDRMSRGLEAIPGWLNCDDLRCAINELDDDPRTISLLRSVARQPEDYVSVGWALAVAMSPNDFPSVSSAMHERNVLFVKANKNLIDGMLDETELDRKR